MKVLDICFVMHYYNFTQNSNAFILKTNLTFRLSVQHLFDLVPCKNKIAGNGGMVVGGKE